MAALLVGMSVMGIMLSMALPVWRTAAIREREAELIFRGEQYAHAIELYSRRTGGYPPSLDVLEKGRFIRKLYKDPVNGGADFQPVYVGQPIAGQPVAAGQAGRGVQSGAPGAGQGGVPAGRAGQAPATQGRGAPAAGQLPASGIGQQAGALPGQAGTIGVGGSAPIIGVVSKSTKESMRLYNGRGRYSEWAFVAVATATQAGGGAGRGQGPPGAPDGQGTGTGVGGRGRGGRGVEQGIPGRGGAGRFGGRGEFPPGRGNPFGLPSFPPLGGQQPGRGPAPRP